MEQGAPPARGRVWSAIDEVPGGCRAVFAANLAVFIYESIAASTPAICPGAFIADPMLYWWMLFVPTFVHLNVLHILFNMMTFHSIGKELERSLGTLCFVALVGQFTLLGNLLYIGLESAATAVTSDAAYVGQCAAGFSGVLFGLIVISSRIGPGASASRSLFGVVTVPGVAYPWLLMAIIQLLIPGVSFVGHLSGALVGLLYSLGAFNFIGIKRSWIGRAESSASFASKPWYHKCPDQSPVSNNVVPTFMSKVATSCWSISCAPIVVFFQQRTNTSASVRSPGHRLGGESNPYGIVLDEFEEGPSIHPDVSSPNLKDSLKANAFP